MSNALERVGGREVGRPIPPGARQLGARVKPIIRLGMGVKVEGRRRDGSTYTRPDKTDYFTVRGDERAVAKFKKVYGEQPKAIKIMVPSSLSLALDISYRAFVGGQADDGGRPLALGMTNFAPLGYVGGSDVLRVWKQDGTYDEIETAGLDELGKPLDEIAASLKIEVYTTFTFTIPDVLGWGSFCQVTSKGKKSADNLTFKLSEIYSAFGSQAPWAFTKENPPVLVIKPDTALTRFEDDGGAKWGKTKIYVLDVVIPEAFDDMRDRLLEHQASLAGSTQQIYGPEPQRQIEQGPPASPAFGPEDVIDAAPLDEDGAAADSGDDARAPGDDDGQQADGTASPAVPSVPGSDDDDDEPTVAAGEQTAFAVPAKAIDEAAATEVPKGTTVKGMALSAVAATEDGERWMSWALRRAPGYWTDSFRTSLELFVEHRLPEVWAAFVAEREAS